MQRMTEEEIRRDVRLSANLEKQVKILADINMTPVKVIQQILDGETWEEALRCIRLPPENSRKPWLKKELLRAATLKRQGMTNAQIAEKLGRTASAVRSAIDVYPEIFGKRATYRPFGERDRRVARESWERGERLCDIAKKLDRAAPTVRQYLQREGIYVGRKERAAHGGGTS